MSRDPEPGQVEMFEQELESAVLGNLMEDPKQEEKDEKKEEVDG